VTDRELKKLNRTELLEMLLAQTSEVERLQKELKETKEKLADQQLQVAKAGSIAEAALQINGVFEAAQLAANQYLDNIRQLERNTQQECDRMRQQTQAEYDRVKLQAEQECTRLRLQTEAECRQLKEETARECRSQVKRAEIEASLFWESIRNKIQDPYREHQWWDELLRILDSHIMDEISGEDL